jgi:hypothetical protein
MCTLLHGPRFHTSSTTPFTGSRLVLRANLVKGSRSHTSSNTLFTSSRLVLCVVTEGDSLPDFPYYSDCWFTASTMCSLLQGPRYHASSTSLFTGSRLVLRASLLKGLAPKLLLILCLLVHD